MWFTTTIQEILQTPVVTPGNPTLQFELSQEAAEHNKITLQNQGNSLHQYLRTQQGTFIYFGAEFRPAAILEKLFCHHPNWPRLKQILIEGSNWPLTPITREERLAKNQELIDRGNHKSALKYTEQLRHTLEKEIAQGWIVPLPLAYISSLKNGEVAPVGMDDKQWIELAERTKQTKF